MKVKCTKIYNEHTKEYQAKSSWITIGKEYVVLTIKVRPNRTHYTIISDDEAQPILQDAIQFELVSGKIPKSWHISSDGVELFFMGPKAWADESDFWDDLYDYEPKAMALYKKEALLIVEQEK